MRGLEGLEELQHVQDQACFAGAQSAGDDGNKLVVKFAKEARVVYQIVKLSVGAILLQNGKRTGHKE